MKPGDPEVMTPEDVAKLLGIAPNTVYEYAARGKLPHRRLGRRVFFSRSAILEWLQGNQTGRKQP